MLDSCCSFQNAYRTQVRGCLVRPISIASASFKWTVVEVNRDT